MLKQFFFRETNMLWAIIINAIVIFFLYFPQVAENWPALYAALDFVDHFFVLLFLIEAGVKISDSEKSYFKDGWNLFDFVIAIASLPSLLLYVGLPFLPNTGVFKVLRLFRLIRIFRFLYFVPRMEQILVGLNRAIKSAVFVLLALLLLNFILAIFTCHFYGELAPNYFGNPLTASFYIFQMFTVEGWNEIPRVIAAAAVEQELDNVMFVIGITRFYFILVVLFGGIFGMSLANAVFVDEMTMDNNLALELKINEMQDQIKELKELLLENSKK